MNKELAFLSRVNKQSGIRLNNLETECWEWTGCTDLLGYGQIQTKYAKEIGTTKTHRISYWLFKGPFDKKLDVLHQCDNRKCVNPEHLKLGTQAENNKERDERGRHKALRGTKNGYSKLTEEDITEIYELRKTGMIYKVIGEKFNVTRRTIERLCVGKTYNQVDTRVNLELIKQERNEKLKQLRKEGKTYAEISSLVGLSQSCICNIINK